MHAIKLVEGNKTVNNQTITELGYKEIRLKEQF